MQCGTSMWLLCAVACLGGHTEAYASNYSITLPEWRQNAGYIAQCDLGNNLCDWIPEEGTTEQDGSLVGESGISRLVSDFLNVSQESCLEFWYLQQNQSSSALKVLLRDDIGETHLWTSPASDSHSWRQAFLPLADGANTSIQVVFELAQGLPEGEEGGGAFDRIGVRAGQCGSQCQSGTSFWTDESTRCICRDGQLSCAHVLCPEGQSCREVVWSKDPSTDGSCTINSDPQYTTFDGVSFRVLGPCTYILSKVCDESATLPVFVVEAQNEQRGNSSVSSVQRVDVNIEGLRVAMLRRKHRKVMVNGIWKNLPLSLNGNTVEISKEGPALVLVTNFNLKVSFRGNGAVEVTVPNQYSDKLCGLCGNFNHLMEDDYKTPDGSQAEDASTLAQSWQTPDVPCEGPSHPSTCPEAEAEEYASERYCGPLLARHGPFAACTDSVNADSVFRSCVFDMCATNGDLGDLCNVLEAFAETCRNAGITLPAWRNSTACSLVCGENSHYDGCASGCPESCSHLDTWGLTCGTCEERCECDDGFRLSGGRCVPAEDCGCWVDGQHYERGMTFMDGHCESLCQCRGQGAVQCSAASCTGTEVCKVSDGVSGCFPSSPATCRVYGDPHYITFDGKAYTFQGTCNYTIAKTCGTSAPKFTITARNEDRGNSTSSSLNAVALEVEGLQVVIRKNKRVYVNGHPVSLPLNASSSVRVVLKDPYVQVDTTLGLRLLFDGDDKLFVQVDERYKGELCGLCGTYSDSQFDDFMMSDGNVVADPFLFASSWNTKDEEWSCSDGPQAPPACPPELESEGEVQCSKLFGDAFSACHWFVPPQIYVGSCVTDHCASDGDVGQLCASLEAYAAACQVAEVDLGHWRNDTVCAYLPPVTPPPVEPTPPPSLESCPLTCDFDRNQCGWEQQIQDSFDWSRQSGSTPTDLTGPTGDHTSGSGSYMYIEGDGVYHGDSARMQSPQCQVTGPLCLSFWYHMYGMANAMALNIYHLQGNKLSKIWSKANNQGNTWARAEVEITARGPFQIIMEGIRGSNNMSDVAVDDVTITLGECKSVEPTVEPVTDIHPVCQLDCDFDSDLCAWTQMLTDSFDWTWQSGSTPTLLTGPSSDHTSGSGRYVYMEGNGRYNGDAARLLSSMCSDPGAQCLEFWYHMYGSASNMQLSVSVVEGADIRNVWMRWNNRGDAWHRARVDINTNRPFQVVFEGRRGTNEYSDVAIDDIKLYQGLCSDLGDTVTQPPSAPSGNTTIQTFSWSSSERGSPDTHVDPITHQQTKGSHPVCNVACTFNNDICTWNQMLTDVFDWTRQRGSTPTQMTGPISDHTTGDGHYLYIEADGVSNGDTARLLSSECADPGEQCLEFWYHMYGTAQTMGLTVYLLQGRWAQEMWSRRNDQGNLWHRALVDLSPEETFQIIFEGRRGTDDRSDVGLDDVTLHRGRCRDLINPPDPSPTSGGSTNRPLPPVEGNATTPFPPVISTDVPIRPESPVPTTAGPAPPAPTTVRPAPTTPQPMCSLGCTFDGDICTWNQLLTDVFDWTRQRGSTPTLMTGPSSDHTTGDGHYLYIEADGVSNGDTARLLSSECADPGEQCLEFWYHMYGTAQTMGLTVYLLQGRWAQEMWSRRNDQGNLWHRALVDLSPEETFQIIFEGRRGTDDRSDVGLDDVILHRGRCGDLINPPDPSPTSGGSTNRPLPPVEGNATTPFPPATSTLRPAPTTVRPETPAPTTVRPETPAPTTVRPGTSLPTTGRPETPAPTTARPETPAPTTARPETPAPTTVRPETPAPTTVRPETPAPTTARPETPAPTTVRPETPAPTTVRPETPAPTTATPETPAPTTARPETPAPTTVRPETPAPTTAKPAPTTPKPTPSCPKNSHYTDCMNTCQPTCKHVNGYPGCNTDEPCLQGCECDPGFVLKQRVCVPIRQCGCQDSHGNNYYFGQVWYGDHCSQRCECEEEDGEGELDCEEYECDGDDICHVSLEGEPSCRSTDFSECTIEDDPEYRTFDDMKHDFEGKHAYVLVQSAGLPKNLPEVYVEAINSKKSDQSSEEDHDDDDDDDDRNSRGKEDSSEEHDDSSEEHDDRGHLHAIKINVYNHTVEFKKNRNVLVNGQRVRTPVSPTPGPRISERSSRLHLKTDFGLAVEFSGRGKAEIVLPHTYKRRVGGLCGNFDGRKKNDMMKPDGGQAKSVKEFGESWRVTDRTVNMRRRRSPRRNNVSCA